MTPHPTPHRVLSMVLAGLMWGQALLGLSFPAAYRDVAWIRATWFGNDWVTLAVATPLLIASVRTAAGGSIRGVLTWLGLLGYAAYNYAFYLFGARLNVFFPLYIAAFVVAIVALVPTLVKLDAADVAARFRPTAPTAAIAAYLLIVGCGLAAVWLVMWAAYVFAGRPTPIEPDAFRLVAALDLSVMVPALVGGGVLLWQRKPWGYVLAPLASIQAALYLLVLSVNSLVAIQRGLTIAPGELPLWGTLAIATTAAALLLLASVRPECDSRLSARTA